MTDNLRRAYAVLGLSPDASLEVVRRQYRVLIKRWHPDRYSSDPAGQADAAVRMREINLAYQTVRATLPTAGAPRSASPGAVDPGVGTPAPSAAYGGRLTRHQIDGIVRAINAPQFQVNWADPWNLSAAALAALHVVFVTCVSWLGPPFLGSVRASLAPVGALCLVGMLLPMIWWGHGFTRLLGGFFLLLFTIMLPAFAIFMAANT